MRLPLLLAGWLALPLISPEAGLRIDRPHAAALDASSAKHLADAASNANDREQTPAGKAAWAQTKCARYGAAWNTLIEKRGKSGLGADFLRQHDAFMASGCSMPPNVCPRSAAELDVANAMVIAAMNAGTASTFPPFRCPRA